MDDQSKKSHRSFTAASRDESSDLSGRDRCSELARSLEHVGDVGAGPSDEVHRQHDQVPEGPQQARAHALLGELGALTRPTLSEGFAKGLSRRLEEERLLQRTLEDRRAVRRARLIWWAFGLYGLVTIAISGYVVGGLPWASLDWPASTGLLIVAAAIAIPFGALWTAASALPRDSWG